MIDIERLKRSADLIDIKELAAIFGKSVVTIRRYAVSGRDGFPQPTMILGGRFWTKSVLLDYIKRKSEEAERANRLMSRGGSA